MVTLTCNNKANPRGAANTAEGSDHTDDLMEAGASMANTHSSPLSTDAARSPREVPLSRGLVALVDEADYEAVVAVGKWYADPNRNTFYARKNFEVEPGRWVSLRMHSFLTGWGMVDHANGDGLDNRRSNLRAASSTQNSQNRGMRSDNTSGYKGVVWNKKSGVWQASISVDGERLYLGSFSTAFEAAAAYDFAALEHFGPFARPNLPASCYTTAEPPSRILASRRAAPLKSACAQGHEFTPENTRMHGAKRVCKACDRARVAAYKQRLRDRAYAGGKA